MRLPGSPVAAVLLALLVAVGMASGLAYAQPKPGTEKSYDLKIVIEAAKGGDKGKLTCTGNVHIKVKDVTQSEVVIDYSLTVDKCNVEGNKSLVMSEGSEADIDVEQILQGKPYHENGTEHYPIDNEFSLTGTTTFPFYVSPQKLPKNGTIVNQTSQSLFFTTLNINVRASYDKDTGLLKDAVLTLSTQLDPNNYTKVRMELHSGSAAKNIMSLAIIVIVVIAVAAALVVLAKRL